MSFPPILPPSLPSHPPSLSPAITRTQITPHALQGVVQRIQPLQQKLLPPSSLDSSFPPSPSSAAYPSSSSSSPILLSYSREKGIEVDEDLANESVFTTRGLPGVMLDDLREGGREMRGCLRS